MPRALRLLGPYMPIYESQLHDMHSTAGHTFTLYEGAPLRSLEGYSEADPLCPWLGQLHDENNRPDIKTFSFRFLREAAALAMLAQTTQRGPRIVRRNIDSLREYLDCVYTGR